jgi:hypothetical protein
MEQKSELNITIVDDKIKLTNKVEREVTLKEAVAAWGKTKEQLKDFQDKEKQLKEAVEKKSWVEELSKFEKNIAKCKEIESKWAKVVEPKLKEIKEAMRVKIKTQKANKNWSRLSDPQTKIVEANNILGPLVEEFGLDMKNQVVLELKKEFDSI